MDQGKDRVIKTSVSDVQKLILILRKIKRGREAIFEKIVIPLSIKISVWLFCSKTDVIVSTAIVVSIYFSHYIFPGEREEREQENISACSYSFQLFYPSWKHSVNDETRHIRCLSLSLNSFFNEKVGK